MKKIRNILIVIGVILFTNYIIHLPMCVKDYAYRDSGIYSSQSMCRHSTITKNIAKEVLSTPVLRLWVLFVKSNVISLIANIFFAIINITVYIWQYARSNISPDVPFYQTHIVV